MKAMDEGRPKRYHESYATFLGPETLASQTTLDGWALWCLLEPIIGYCRRYCVDYALHFDFRRRIVTQLHRNRRVRASAVLADLRRETYYMVEHQLSRLVDLRYCSAEAGITPPSGHQSVYPVSLTDWRVMYRGVPEWTRFRSR